MNSNNPYKTPKSDVSRKPQAHSDIDGLSDEDIKKLNKFSSDINILGTFSVLCALASAYYIYEIFFNGYGDPIWPIFGLFVACATAYSAFMRPSWGRPVCMIVSLLLLPGFPIGTFLGYIGVRAALDGKRLFGDEGLTNHELGEAISKIEQQSA
ncbi:MAG: hypothetical protein ABW118_18180 [Candidatus Thiodiazotropha sp.]